MKSGKIITDRSASRGSSRIMMPSVSTSITMLVMILTSVPVTARWAPTTSLLSRDTSSPDLVLVKKRSAMRCIWS